MNTGLMLRPRVVMRNLDCFAGRRGRHLGLFVLPRNSASQRVIRLAFFCITSETVG
jgi:hypothetical protein